MLVVVIELAVVRRARVSTKSELGTREDTAEAHVEGHIAVVGI